MRSRMSDKTGAAIRKLRLARGWNLATLSEQSLEWRNESWPRTTRSRFLTYEERQIPLLAEGLTLESLLSLPVTPSWRTADGSRSCSPSELPVFHSVPWGCS